MEAWENFLSQQSKKMGDDTVRQWLKPLKVLHYDAHNLYLEAESSFQAIWFEEHIRNVLRAELLDHQKKPIKVHLSIANMPSAKKVSKGKQSKDSEKNNSSTALPPFKLIFDTLDPSCNFQNFVCSRTNSLPYQLLCEIAGYDAVHHQLKQISHDCPSVNPIYICGGSGTGKTHLMMSLAYALRQQGKKVLYSRAETFTEHVVSAIRAGEMGVFRQAYRNSDVLLIDDVHVFSRKGATQEELFHTFNTLHLENKPIVLSSNCTPRYLQYIEPRLVSRFEWGIVLSLETLKGDEIKDLLSAKATALQFPLTHAISDFLLQTFTSNPKSLVRALEALALRAHLNNTINSYKEKMSPHEVRDLLSDLIDEEQKHSLTATKIIHMVAEYYGICSSDILGKAQTKEFTLPRQIAMYICRHKLSLPFMKIGDIFERDHSTVMSSVRLIQKHKEGGKEDVAAAILSIEKKIARL